MNEHRVDESFLTIKSHSNTESAPLKLYMGDLSEYAHAENMAALPTNARESLLANRYQLQQVLGQGGFGRTFLALDRHRFNETCVVKEFLPQQQGDNEIQKSRELFVREAKILNRIDCDRVPKFFACFEEDRKLFLVQEYIKGQTYAHLLHERQQQGRTFSEIEVIQWLKDLLPVLTYLHDRQILHRDISLDNVMRQDDSHLPVLIDFGIGRSALLQGQSRVENGSPPVNYLTQRSIVGKIGYAPYEQIWLGQSFPSSDLYALAVSAVVMLSGSDPQALNHRLLLEAEWQSQHSVSNGLVKILNRMLQDIPSNRYQTAAANLADLEQLSTDSRSTATGPIAPPKAPPTVIRLTPESTERCEPESIELASSTDSQVSVDRSTSSGAFASLNAPPTKIQPQPKVILTPEFIAQCERESIELASSTDSQVSVDRSTSSGVFAPLNTPPTKIQPQVPTVILTPEFIAQCERESIEYVGPIGKFLVQNAIAKNPHLSPADLIDLLAQHISFDRADEFRSKLRKFTNN